MSRDEEKGKNAGEGRRPESPTANRLRRGAGRHAARGNASFDGSANARPVTADPLSLQAGKLRGDAALRCGSLPDGPWPLIGGNAQQTDVDQLMRDNLLPPNKYRPGFTPMVVNTGKALILFDTGNGERGFVSRPQGGWLAAQLAPAGLRPDQIDMVVLSHGHPDHIGGLFEGGKPLFPAAQYAIGDVEYDFWAGDKPAGGLEKFAELFRDYVVPLAGKTRFIKPNSAIVPGIRAVEAYGHTPGHLAFDIESDGKRLFFWGDCAHHQVASLARPDWHCVFDVDPTVGAETRGRIFDMVATDRLAVSGFHMPFPSIGYVERRRDGGYRWLPHSYQLDI